MLAAGACGIVMGVATIVDAWDSMFFFPALLHSLLGPIGIGIAFWKLSVASRMGSTRAFYASWILTGVLMAPASIAVYVLVLRRWPISFLQEFPQMSLAERIGLASLTVCLPLLAAIVAVGARVRIKMKTGRR